MGWDGMGRREGDGRTEGTEKNGKRCENILQKRGSRGELRGGGGGGEKKEQVNFGEGSKFLNTEGRDVMVGQRRSACC